VRVVQLATFVAPTSGGLRTALEQWRRGYAAAGHEAVLVAPGPGPRSSAEGWTGPAAAGGEEVGTVVLVPAPRVPGRSGYRLLWRRAPVRRVLEELAPDRLEVSDRSVLRWAGAWAAAAGVPSVVVSHESLDGLAARRWPGGEDGPAARWRRAAVDRANAATAAAHDRVVATTAFAAAEMERVGARVDRVPLGVDLVTFAAPCAEDRAAARGAEGAVRLVHCGRLSPEKEPRRSVEALRVLRSRGVDATLDVLGDGPCRPALERAARDLPVHFHGFVADRRALARRLGAADVALATGPLETFGLAALEALACGTPVVAAGSGALPEVVGDAGVAVDQDGAAFADGVLELLARPPRSRRAAARRRAETFGWAASSAGMLAVHEAARSRVGR